jgi:hypothetical protein
MRDLVGKRKRDFAQGFTKPLTESRPGPPFGFFDLNLAESILNSARGKEFGMSEFVRAPVQSKSFRLKERPERAQRFPHLHRPGNCHAGGTC